MEERVWKEDHGAFESESSLTISLTKEDRSSGKKGGQLKIEMEKTSRYTILYSS